MRHRHLLEDIGHCMVPWYELGLKCGLSSPTIKAIIDLASVVSGFDYLSPRKGLEAAGLGEASKEQISMALQGSLHDAPHALAPLLDTSAKVNAVEGRSPMQKAPAAA